MHERRRVNHMSEPLNQGKIEPFGSPLSPTSARSELPSSVRSELPEAGMADRDAGIGEVDGEGTAGSGVPWWAVHRWQRGTQVAYLLLPRVWSTRGIAPCLLSLAASAQRHPPCVTLGPKSETPNPKTGSSFPAPVFNRGAGRPSHGAAHMEVSDHFRRLVQRESGPVPQAFLCCSDPKLLDAKY
jgi:hypothetical protein